VNYKQARAYCLSLPEAWEDHPFGPDTLAIKVKKKVFAILFSRKDVNGNTTSHINLKCDPEQAIGLRDIFSGVNPGYHMNKKHWNTVNLDDSVPSTEVTRMIDHSYALVVKSLGSQRQSMEIIHGADTLYRA